MADNQYLMYICPFCVKIIGRIAVDICMWPNLHDRKNAPDMRFGRSGPTLPISLEFD